VHSLGSHGMLPSAFGLLIWACTPAELDSYRGAGQPIETLPLSDRVAIHRAALASSFTLGDPTLSILVDTTLLTRSSGLAGGDAMDAALVDSMRAHGLVKGTCTIPAGRTREPLVCPAGRAGYVVRFSPPFRLGRDSVQMHLVVQQYAIPDGPRAERLRFERAYHVARRGSAWRAVREARMPQP
jgi:hypothetical protein